MLRTTFRHFSALLCLLVFSTNAEAQWVEMGNPQGGAVTSFAAIGVQFFVGTGSSGVFRSSDLGERWILASSGIANASVWALAAMDTVLYAGTYGAGVYRSTDLGTTWESVGDSLSHSLVTCLVVNGRDLFAGSLEGIYRLNDNRDEWVRLDSGLSNTYARTLSVNGSRIYLGTYGGGISYTTDRGITWTQQNAGLANTFVQSFAFLSGCAFAGTYGGVFRAATGDTVWSPVNLSATVPASTEDGVRRAGVLNGEAGQAGLSSPKAVYALTANGSDVYVATYGSGVLRSSNLGSSWEPMNDSLGNLNLTVISVFGDFMFAGALDGQIWRRPLQKSTSADETWPMSLPEKPELLQNYPNPFNPTTTIEYTVSGARGQGLGASEVRIVIYDMIGREVATIVNARQAPGSYTVKFDGSGLASGVYFYRLTAGGYSVVRAMVLER